MRGIEQSKLWATLMLAGLLGGCAAMSQTDGAAEAESEAVMTEAGTVEMNDDDEGGVFAGATAEVEPVGRSPLAELAAARGAIDSAATDIRMAEARGMQQPEAQAWLEQARKAVDAGDATQASKLANEAGSQARLALDDYYADMTRQRIALLRKDYSDKMSSSQAMRLDSAESALNAGKSEVALMLVGSLVDEIAPNATFESHRTRSGKLTHIIIKEGDTLSAIAARPDVYGNADLWPLLLKANRDKFLRVDEVPVGVELVIPRNASQEEIDQAMALTR